MNDARQDVDDRSLPDLVFHAVKQHGARSIQDVVQLGRPLVIVRPGAVNIDRVCPGRGFQRAVLAADQSVSPATGAPLALVKAFVTYEGVRRKLIAHGYMPPSAGTTAQLAKPRDAKSISSVDRIAQEAEPCTCRALAAASVSSQPSSAPVYNVTTLCPRTVCEEVAHAFPKKLSQLCLGLVLGLSVAVFMKGKLAMSQTSKVSEPAQFAGGCGDSDLRQRLLLVYRGGVPAIEGRALSWCPATAGAR